MTETPLVAAYLTAAATDYDAGLATPARGWTRGAARRARRDVAVWLQRLPPEAAADAEAAPAQHAAEFWLWRNAWPVETPHLRFVIARSLGAIDVRCVRGWLFFGGDEE